MSEEKQSVALRFEAEITSLKLQLDRCRNELVHYTTEATRLAQQLRLKNQYEEDQFKKHLESQVSNELASFVLLENVETVVIDTSSK